MNLRKDIEFKHNPLLISKEEVRVLKKATYYGFTY
jgi:hypothetical protein